MKNWSREEDALLASLWLGGYSCSQIARMLHAEGFPSRSRNAVIGRRFRVGLPDRAIPSAPKRASQPRKPRPQWHCWQRNPNARRQPPAPQEIALVDPLHVSWADLDMATQCRTVSRRDERTTETWHCGNPVAEEATFCRSCVARFYDVEPRPVVRRSPAPRTRLQMLAGFGL